MTNAPLPFGLGLPLAPIYGFVVARRNKRFDKGVGVRTPPVPVICVGNLTVGGTGKTPMVRHVVSTLKMAGRRPGIVLRGYGPRRDGVSDEHAEHRERNPGVPVISNPNRYEGIAQIISMPTGPRPDCVVLDDGFQHRRLRRQLDIVLIDATRSPFSDRLLPAGWLREPAANLARASAVVLTRADQLIERELRTLREQVARVTGSNPIAETRHAWATEAEALIDGRETTKPLSWLRGKRILVASGIGNPTAFENQARLSGATVVSALAFRDHAAMGPRDVAKLTAAATGAGAEAIFCTSKDWTKLRHAPAAGWPCPVVRPVLELEFLRGRDALDQLVLAALSAGDEELTVDRG